MTTIYALTRVCSTPLQSVVVSLQCIVVSRTVGRVETMTREGEGNCVSDSQCGTNECQLSSFVCLLLLSPSLLVSFLLTRVVYTAEWRLSHVRRSFASLSAAVAQL